MSIEGVVDGIELSSEFLDELFVAIRDKLPFDKWVLISKDRDRAVAGIKHLIDCRMYGEEMDVSFNSEFTHFRKTSTKKPQPHPFEGRYMTSHPQSCWAEQDSLIARRKKRELEQARRSEERDQYKKRKRKRR